MVPILGDDATLTVADGELRYFEHRFPLAPGTWTEGDDPEAVHARQHYELVHHSRGNAELNYRRFFAVTTLAGVRVEDPAVLEATHALVPSWVESGVTGLRIDHPDGLVDPAEYLDRLRALAPDAWITVEKILEAGEELPKSWPVAGTTGYDAMREVNGVFVDPDREPELTALYTRLTGDERTIAEHVEQGKRMVVETLLPAEVRRMAALVPGGPRRRAGAGRGRRRLPRLPLLPARRGRTAGRGHRHRPGPPAGAGRDPGRPGRPAARPGRRAGPADAAAQRGHHGQGRRGHRLLPLRPVHRPERGRRRPRPARHPAARSSTPCRPGGRPASRSR